MKSIRINVGVSILSILAAGFFAGCASTIPQLPEAGTAADPHAHVSAHRPNNLLVSDETTTAIESELSQGERSAKSAQTMHHDMNNMPGMQMGDMPGTKMEDHKDMSQPTNGGAEKKAVADEMKKTSDEMKTTSEELRKKSEQTNAENFYYTCVMHPQIHADKPGKCPICGMTLIKKEGAPSK